MSAEHEWLNLLEVSGPFLAVPVLREAFSQGLEELETSRVKRLRSAYEEWRDAVDADDADIDRLHAAWIDEVLRTALEVDDSVLRNGDRVPVSSIVELSEHDTSIMPDLVLVDPTHGDALLSPIHVFPPDTDLSASMKFGGLACSPGDRMALHLRALGKPFGLVTNGERWMLVHAPPGQVATFASWYARLWGQEPQTLRAFASLLSIRRFFAPEQDRLPALFERSLKHQDEVTDALGDQVRRAIEVLVQALDRADQDRNRELLRDVRPQELYEAGLTVMMRLVFLLAAEERGLLLLGEPRYDSFYAVSTLRMQLRAETDEILERRRAAWSRLLAVFRAVYGGIDHPTLHLPAMGGSLFDPDRFPFLEGRLKGTSWHQHRAEPLPIDDRTILLLLEAIQTFEGRTLSYRALDVEQIGHVYEGLLERTVARVEDVTLELEAGAQAKDARVTLGELESARLDGQRSVVNLLVERSKRSESAIRNALAAEVEPQQGARLLSACRGDVVLRDRLEPYVHLLRTDPWGYPLVHPKEAFVVVLGADRRETGTHYTPKSLTERIVEETLTPLVYEGPAKGAPRNEWKLKTPTEILDLKVCDPAMGSGAFLVQACRFLSARLVEAWVIEDVAGRIVDLTGQVHESGSGVEPMPPGAEARAEQARRIVAERCLYGVDPNPLAVELAKLSLWLVTLSKNRPFGFLDHNLRRGDSLLGVSRLEQLTELSMTTPSTQQQGRLFGKRVRQAVDEALSIRQQLREVPIRDIHDVEAMASFDAAVRSKLDVSKRLADAFIATVFATEKASLLESRLVAFGVEADQIVGGDKRSLTTLESQTAIALSADASSGCARSPFHWPLEFPEVFGRADSGFDAVIGNPPFLGGKRIAQILGDAYNAYLKLTTPRSKGAADLCAYFHRRTFELIRAGGTSGLLATNTIGQGDTREVGLDVVLSMNGTIFSATSLVVWPGSANVHASVVNLVRGKWYGVCVLDGRQVAGISSRLTEDLGVLPKPLRLRSAYPRASGGTQLSGIGFVVGRDLCDEWIGVDPKYEQVLWPYINGKELNSIVSLVPPRYVINFEDRSEEQAEQFPLAIARVRQLVRPRRDALTKQIHESSYWKHWDKREALYRSIRGLRRVLACSFVSKHLPFTFLPTGWIYSKELVVIPSDDAADFSLLQSSFHAVWVRHFSGTLKSDLSYSISDGLRTFAGPSDDGSERRGHGEAYLRQRQTVMELGDLGLTAVYNRFHDPIDADPSIEGLRRLHIANDLAVLRAYGWGDLDLDHEFHEVAYLPESDRVRFTISEPARLEVLRRLSELNRQRHSEEAVDGPGSLNNLATSARSNHPDQAELEFATSTK